METLEFTATSAGIRLDKFVSEQTEGEITRSAAVKLIEDGNCTVNGKQVQKNYKLKAGDKIVLEIPEAVDVDILPEDIPLDIVYEDNDLLVVNKPKGMVVHPAPGHYSGTLVNALMYHCKDSLSGINGEIRPGIVHRIDKDTSGIVVYAKNEEAHKSISTQFADRLVKKTYHCLVNGHPNWTELKVTLPLLPDGDARHRTVVNKRTGKHSETDFKVVGTCGPYAWIIAHPKTGRTHQIRAHLQTTGFPIVCDPLYSGNQKPVRLSDFKRKWNGDTEEERPLLNRLALHAYQIEFNHPKTNERLLFTAPYPRDLEAVRKQLAKLFKVDPFVDEE